MPKFNDYEIVPFKMMRPPRKEKFKILCGGVPVTVKDTREEAAREIVKLVKDPSYYDRGQTRKDRVTGW